jgi:hypothetical protein
MLAAAESLVGAGADSEPPIILAAGVILVVGGIVIRVVLAHRFTGLHAPLKALAELAAAPRRHPVRTTRMSRRFGRRRAGPAGSARAQRAVPPAGQGVRAANGPPTPATIEPWRAGRHDQAVMPVASVARGAAGPASGRAGGLARTLERSRRLMAAEQRVACELAALEDGCWLVERYVLMGNRRIPFLIVAASGVFVICATDGAWTLDDVRAMSELADEVARPLADDRVPVHAAVCLAFDEHAPRAWFGGVPQRGRGGWVVGLDWLTPWLRSFEPLPGIRDDDIRRLNRAAGPDWSRRVSARLPVAPRFG